MQPYPFVITKEALSSINRVQANRLRQGLSQAQLSEKVGGSRTAVATILTQNPQKDRGQIFYENAELVF